MKKVFIIEDNESFAKLLEKSFQSLGGLEIYLFNSVETALGKISIHPDFIVLDHFLTKAKGIDCIPIFREFSPFSKIIVVSSQTDIVKFQEAWTFGADEYFFKDAIAVHNVVGYVSKTINQKPTNWLESLLRRSSSRKHNMKKVWILEDNETTAFSIEFVVAGVDKNRTKVLTRTEDFNRELELDSPDVLVLDYHLDQGETGIDILKKVKRMSPKTKVIILSAQKDVVLAIEMVSAGASYYLVKSTDNYKKLPTLITSL